MNIKLYINRDTVVDELKKEFPSHFAAIIGERFPGHVVEFEWTDCESHAILPPVAQQMGFSLPALIDKALKTLKEKQNDIAR